MKATRSDETLKVAVRVRPLNNNEIRQGCEIATTADIGRGVISLRNPKSGDAELPKEFSFDAVFAPDVEQRFIYDTVASSIVDSVLTGFNGTIFAYGQTGSGKTFSMEGSSNPPSNRGIAPNAFQHIFDFLATTTDQQFLVRASYLEIYNEEIRDLLAKAADVTLDIKENFETGVYVKDLTHVIVKNAAEIDHHFQRGSKRRTTAPTGMNDKSSRSHGIFTVIVESSSGGHIRVGRLNLVDLAGSERQVKTQATGSRLAEAGHINKSLLVLGNVIMALADGKSTYIPYRDSKLTRLLQNSLGGNAKTLMCANVGPANYNYDETLSTLRYANRAKNIKNKPKINQDPKDAMLREYEDTIRALKAQLEASQMNGGVGVGSMLSNAPRFTQSDEHVQKEVIEKIVEREVIKEVHIGISEEEVEALRQHAEEEREQLKKQAAADISALLQMQRDTAIERAQVQAALEEKVNRSKKLEEETALLQQKLRAMEEKLIKGGEIMSKAQKHETALRRAEAELRKRHEQDMVMARQLAEKEEANLQLEEHFGSLQDEVEIKTKKLKKLWAKYQAATRENKDLEEEFQVERTDMMSSMHELDQTVKLQKMLIDHFIPEEMIEALRKRATYHEEEDRWIVPRMDLSGNVMRVSRPIASTNNRRPETEFARQRKQFDTNPRYRAENILMQGLDMPDSQKYFGPTAAANMDKVLMMDLGNFNEADQVAFYEPEAIPNPYLKYDGAKASDERSILPVVVSGGERTRPRSAARSSSRK